MQFEELVVGQHHTGNLVQNPTLALGGSLPPFDGLRKMRDRMLRQYFGPAAVAKAHEQKRADGQRLRAIIIANRRYSEAEVRMFKEVASELTNAGRWTRSISIGRPWANSRAT